MIENFKEEFLKFCKSKPEDETYDISLTRQCALGQFITTKGCIPLPFSYYDPTTSKNYDYESDSMNAAINDTKKYIDTFGNLVKRLEQ